MLQPATPYLAAKARGVGRPHARQAIVVAGQPVIRCSQLAKIALQPIVGTACTTISQIPRAQKKINFGPFPLHQRYHGLQGMVGVHTQQRTAEAFAQVGICQLYQLHNIIPGIKVFYVVV